ncbi:hypothetical protein CHELA40_14810 [Chelatococcus asaccharovorans]|nr:hypothetical protein CHELA17_60811 [Chelatococcus asaccharovorans]CAH1680107.1 hypothetical protein CHELA40_14810 [Chelatococcus asaccharovorans]
MQSCPQGIGGEPQTLGSLRMKFGLERNCPECRTLIRSPWRYNVFFRYLHSIRGALLPIPATEDMRYSARRALVPAPRPCRFLTPEAFHLMPCRREPWAHRSREVSKPRANACVSFQSDSDDAPGLVFEAEPRPIRIARSLTSLPLPMASRPRPRDLQDRISAPRWPQLRPVCKH